MGNRLQRFKLDIAGSVLTQQNASLGSMNTGQVLDLFKVSADGQPKKATKAGSGPVSASKILDGCVEFARLRSSKLILEKIGGLATRRRVCRVIIIKFLEQSVNHHESLATDIPCMTHALCAVHPSITTPLKTII